MKRSKTKAPLTAACLCLLLSVASHAGDAGEEMERSLRLLKAQSELKALDKVGAATRELSQATKDLETGGRPIEHAKEELGRTLARSQDPEGLDLIGRLNSPDLDSHPAALREAGLSIGTLSEAAQHALVVRVSAMADDASETAETRRDAYRLLGSWLPSLKGAQTRALSFDSALGPLRARPSEGRIAYRFEAIVGLTPSVDAVPTATAEEDAFAQLLCGVIDDARAAQRERQVATILLKKLLVARPAIGDRDAVKGGRLARTIASRSSTAS